MLQCFDREKETNTKQNRWNYVRQLAFYFSSIIFNKKKNHVFIEEDKPSEKVVTAEEELNCFDIDSIGLPRFVFINDKCGYLKVVNDGGELTRDINQKKKHFQKPLIQG